MSFMISHLKSLSSKARPVAPHASFVSRLFCKQPKPSPIPSIHNITVPSTHVLPGRNPSPRLSIPIDFKPLGWVAPDTSLLQAAKDRRLTRINRRISAQVHVRKLEEDVLLRDAEIWKMRKVERVFRKEAYAREIELEAKNEELQAALDTKTDEVLILHDVLEEQEKEIRGLLGAIEVQEGETEGLQSALALKEEDIRQLEEIVEAKGRSIRKLKSSLVAKDEDVRTLGCKLEVKEAAIDNLERMLSREYQGFLELSVALQAKDDIIKSLERDVLVQAQTGELDKRRGKREQWQKKWIDWMNRFEQERAKAHKKWLAERRELTAKNDDLTNRNNRLLYQLHYVTMDTNLAPEHEKAQEAELEALRELAGIDVD